MNVLIESFYACDDIGNRVTSTECGTNSLYTANNLNQYTQITNVNLDLQPQPFTPQYDADGNQTLVKTSTGVWSVTYNGENRPVCWSNGTTVVTMDFDCMGRRTYYREMNGNSQVTFTRFLYDGYVMIQQLFSNSPYNVYKEFVWDPTEAVATKPLCFRQYGESDAYLMHDGNKNVTDVIAAATSAESLAHYEYAPFGAVTAATGTRASSNPYRFSSELSDDALGLVYYNYRHYLSSLGCWLTRDYFDDYRYLFVRNMPTILCDYAGAISMDGCNSAISAAIHRNAKARKMLSELQKKGCHVPRISCYCDAQSTIMGVFDPGTKDITINSVNNDIAADVIETVVHELTHACDDCNGTDWSNCAQLAEAEVRAYDSEGVCRPAGPSRNSSESYWDCVRRRAEKSVQANSTCLNSASRYVDEAIRKIRRGGEK